MEKLPLQNKLTTAAIYDLIDTVFAIWERNT